MLLLAAMSISALNCSSGGPSEGADVVDLAALTIARCEPESVVTGTAIIGNEGGTITAGLNSLVVPAQSLSDSVEITMQVGGDSSRSVTFLPEGIQFQSARPSLLTLAYNGCEFPEDSVGNPAGHIPPSSIGIVYVGNDQQVLEFLPATIDTAANTVSGSLRHFSRYAVAW